MPDPASTAAVTAGFRKVALEHGYTHHLVAGGRVVYTGTDKDCFDYRDVCGCLGWVIVAIEAEVTA